MQTNQIYMANKNVCISLVLFWIYKKSFNVTSYVLISSIIFLLQTNFLLRQQISWILQCSTSKILPQSLHRGKYAMCTHTNRRINWWIDLECNTRFLILYIFFYTHLALLNLHYFILYSTPYNIRTQMIHPFHILYALGVAFYILRF